MKHKVNAKIGNGLMGIGMVMMMLGFCFSILSYSSDLGLSNLHAQSAIVAIFLGAFIWLVGVRFSGTERIVDKYWAIRRVEQYKKQHRQLGSRIIDR